MLNWDKQHAVKSSEKETLSAWVLLERIRPLWELDGGGGRFKWISCVCLCPLRYDTPWHDMPLRLAPGHGNTSDAQHKQ